MIGRAVPAEWVKLRSVPSSGLALLALVALTMLLSLTAATLGRSEVNQQRLWTDQFHFVHRPMPGDGTLIVRVAAQKNTSPWAKAGLMIKDGLGSDSPYAAIMVTPGHGVLLQGTGQHESTSPDATGPRWLRLTRTGRSVTGAESADGVSWRTVGTVDLPAGSEAGLFVGSPPVLHASGIGYEPVLGEATFTAVDGGQATGLAQPDQNDATRSGPATDVTQPDRNDPTRSGHATDLTQPDRNDPTRGGQATDVTRRDRNGAVSGWRDTDVVQPDDGSAVGEGAPTAPPLAGGSRWHADGSVTVTGSGDIGAAGMGGINLTDMDPVRGSLIGVQFGLVGALALGTLFMTSEFRTRMIRTTFTAHPGRGTVLAAKSVVLAVVVFSTGLAVAVPAYLVTRPMQVARGFGPPVYPESSIFDPAVIRAIVGAALFLALIALFSLAVGTIVRHTAGAVIVLLSVLVIVPTVAGTTSPEAYSLIGRATPLAGLAILQTIELSPVSTVAVTGPLTGLAVLAGWTAAAMAAAFWLLARRDA